jgi:pimeloyl-ACP methyl ester carboxylesterase
LYSQGVQSGFGLQAVFRPFRPVFHQQPKPSRLMMASTVESDVFQSARRIVWHHSHRPASHGLSRMGRSANPRALCVHGLTRTGRDFDALARRWPTSTAWSARTWSGAAARTGWPTGTGHAVPQYVSDMVTLIARLNVEQVDWFGTSMGGLIGMGWPAGRRRCASCCSTT